MYQIDFTEEEIVSVIAGSELYRLEYESENGRVDIEDEDYRSILSAQEKAIMVYRRGKNE